MKTTKHKMIGLKKLRKARKLSQSDLAEIMGLRQCQVSQMESGLADPKLSLLIRLAGFFGVKIDDLI